MAKVLDRRPATATLTLKIDELALSQLDEAASMSGKTRSTFAREVLTQYCKFLAVGKAPIKGGAAV